MLQAFTYKYFVKNFYSVNLHLGKTEIEFHIIQFTRNKSTVKIIKQESISDINQVFNDLKKEIPIIISFTGKKIINKIVPPETNYLEKILFNKDPDSYYILEYIKFPNNLVSIARKEDIDLYITKFREHGFTVLDFILGPFVLESISSLLRDYNKIKTEVFEYDRKNTLLQIIDQSKKTETKDFKIGADIVTNSHILAFAGFFSYLSTDGFIKNYQADIDASLESFSYKKTFSTVGKFILILFLFLLSASYITRSIYSKKNEAIQQEALLYNQALNELATLKKDKEYKESIIKNSSLGSNHFLTFYISKITSQLPENILLEELNIFPAKKPIRPNEKINIEPNIITIGGITASKTSVNAWVAVLNKYKWVKKIELTSYAYVKNEYVFKLNLFI